MSATNRNVEETTGWAGWVFFAGLMLGLSGFFQAIAGLVALFQNQVYVVTTNHLIALDYTQWGWVHLLLGIVLIISAGSLFSGRLWGRLVGITVASLSAIANFAFLNAYPVWSLVMIVVDILVIYAIAVHGTELAE